MKKYDLYVGVILVATILSACEPPKKDKISIEGANVIPQSLKFEAPPAGAELTQDQISEIKKEFSVKSTMILPPGALFFPDKKLTQNEINRMENELKAKDLNSYELLLETKNNCKQSQNQIKYEATFPTDKPIDINQLTISDKIEASVSAAIAGDNCPIAYTGGLSLSGNVTDKNDQTKELAVKAGYNIKVSAVMKNPKYAELLGLRGMVVDASISGLAAKKELVSGNLVRLLISFKLSGSYLSLKSDIPYSAEVKVLGESNSLDTTQNSFEIVANLDLKMKGFDTNLIFHQVMKNNIVISKVVYVNGHVKTDEQLKALFGKNIPNPIAQSQAVMQSFN